MGIEDLARELIRAYSDNDQHTWRAMLADDVVYREPASRTEAHGVDEVMKACFGWKDAWPDLGSPVERVTGVGDRVACEMVWKGAQTGPFALPDGSVFPPSGKTTVVPACMVMTFKDGKCVEMNHYFDALWFMVEIGVIPLGAA